MSDGGKTRPRARGEDPTATGVNPLYADGPAAATGGRSTSQGRKALDEASVYAEVVPARPAEGGRAQCSRAELCGYFVCPLTAVCLALGAFVLAVLLLAGVLRPLGPSKELAELQAAIQALQQSLESMTSPPLQVATVGLRTADFSHCKEQRFTCSLNATSRTCGMELGPVQPSYISPWDDGQRLTSDRYWYQVMQAQDTGRVSLQLYLREVQLGNYSSADMFCLATSSFSADESGVVHLYHRDCPIKDFILLST